MATDLAVIERQLHLLEPRFVDVLKSSGIPVERIIRTVLISIERLPKLLECSQPSILSAAMTAACLGLEVDGATGQGFLIPFAGKAQFVVGYKGMNTMAARSGFTINGGLVREGDHFDFQLGTDGYIHHKPKFPATGKILGAWAIAEAPGKAPIIGMPLDIDQLMAVKEKSPGARKADSPWNDPAIGFPAMCEKTAKRRLARAMPLNLMVMAGALGDAFEERGRHAFITPERGLIIDGEAQPMTTIDKGPANLERPSYSIMLSDGGSRTYPTSEQWVGAVKMVLSKMASSADLDAFVARNRDIVLKLREVDPKSAEAAEKSLEDRRRILDPSMSEATHV